MKTVFFSAAFALLAGLVTAQSWEYLTPLKSNTEVRGCSFLNANLGIATLTIEGRLVQTQDGGQTWRVLATPIFSGSYYDVEYVSEDSIFFCGSNGSLYRSVDGGNSWIDLNPPSGEWLYQLHFINSQIGFASGLNGTILRTEDGGDSWSLIPSGTTNRLWGIDFVDENTGFIAGWNGTILKTTDAGLNWSQLTPGNTASYQNIYFIDSQTGWVCGSNGTILKTTNGGTSWSLQTGSGSNTLNFIHFRTPLIGWAVGALGTYYTTTNGGSSWTTTTTLGNNDLYCGAHVSADASYLMGMRTMYKSTNNGANWALIKTGVPRADFAGLHFLDDNTGTVVGRVGTAGTGSNQGGIVQTSDGGLTWSVRQQSSSGGWNAVHFPNASTGYVVASGNLAKTTNGGVNWTYTTPFTNSASCVLFTDTQKGWIGASFASGGICSTTNGGSSFSCLSNYVVSDIFFVNANLGWAITGVGGTTIYKTVDGGLNWEYVSGNGGTCVYFVSEMVGWVGSAGTILKTSDGGLTWTTTYVGWGDILDIRFYSENLGFAVSSAGEIFKSTDAGETWELFFYDEDNGAGGLCAQLTNDYCYIAGGPGEIYRCQLGCNSFQAGLINGDNEWCENETGTLAVSQVNGALSYDWTLPEGWSGATDSFVIQPVAGATSGLVSVTITNACSLQSTVSYDVTVTQQVEEITGIEGAVNVCPSGEYLYSIPEDPNATDYVWQTSAGLLSTNSGNELLLSSASSNGLITVQSVNACGASNYAVLNITVWPMDEVYLDLADDSLCSGTITLLTGGDPAGGTYSGDFVTEGMLDLSTAPLGLTEVLYTYTDSNGCESQASDQVHIINQLPHPANLNGDCSIDEADLQIILQSFGCLNDCGSADLSGDGIIGVEDVVVLMGYFGL